MQLWAQRGSWWSDSMGVENFIITRQALRRPRKPISTVDADQADSPDPRADLGNLWLT